MTIKLFEAEVKKILNNSKSFSFPKIDLKLHTPDDDIKIKYPQYLEFTENHNTGLFPEVYLDFMLPMGDYKEFILPHKDNLEVSIVIETETSIEDYRFKLIILNTDTESKTSRFGRFGNKELNKMDNVMIKGQCIDPLLLLLKDKFVSGSFLDTTHDKVIKYLLSNSLKDIKIAGKQISFDLDMRDLDNTEQYEHIIVKSYTKLAKLVYTMQNFGYGLYNGGVNMFIRQLKPQYYRFYIYPIYNYELFEKINEDKIMFYNSSRIGIDKNDMDFFKDNKIYKMVTSDIKIENKGIMDLLKLGNTYIENDQTYVMTKDNIEITPDIFKINPKPNNVIKTLKINDIKFPFLNPLVTHYDANLYKYRSQILMNNMIDATLKLNMVNIYFIRPGMLLKYLFVKSGVVEEKRGVMQATTRIYNFNKKETSVLLKFKIER